jgi:hypothetical protein
VGSGKWEVRSEKWEVGSGKWEVGSEKWEVRSEKWEVRSEKWEVRSCAVDVTAPGQRRFSGAANDAAGTNECRTGRLTSVARHDASVCVLITPLGANSQANSETHEVAEFSAIPPFHGGTGAWHLECAKCFLD